MVCDGDVAKKELNLLQFAAGGTTEARATSTKVVRREFAYANFGRKLLNNMPAELFGYSFAPNSAGAHS